MKKLIVFPILLVAVLAAYAANDTHNNISRLTRGVGVVGGSSDTTGRTLVTSDSTTVEYKVSGSTVSFSAADTTKTVTFTKPYSATPTLVVGVPDGFSMTGVGNAGASTDVYGYSKTTVLATYSASVFTRPAASTGTAMTIPAVWYGTVRTGVYQ